MQFSNILFLLLISASFLTGGTGLKKGDDAPAFELKDGDGKVHKLTDYKEKILALYFYPKDFTGGCTEQACNLRDNFSQLKDAGVVILGVSYDDNLSHQKFSEEYNLPFPLLSDTEKKVTEAYGAKKDTGKISRMTFIIDGAGKILHIFEKVDTANHSAQILAVINPKEEK